MCPPVPFSFSRISHVSYDEIRYLPPPHHPPTPPHPPQHENSCHPTRGQRKEQNKSKRQKQS